MSLVKLTPCLVMATILTISLVFISPILASQVTVPVPNGQVIGQTVEMLNSTVNQFLGIRYGQTPVGQLRFRKPQPFNLTGTYEALHSAGICWQTNSSKYQEKDMTEDCLVLNIWSPGVKPRKLLPVMIWQHGGGFMSGASYRYSYNGSALAKFGVVVVNFNFRLTTMGFLFSGDEQAPGNVGLHDQVLAMQWVQNNIRYFGGDPNQVTIFGISSGGMSVGLHILSPLSTGLYQRAIMSSGSPYVINSLTTDRSLSLEMSREVARQLNCTVDSTNTWVDCLREVGPKQLVAAQNQVMTKSTTMDMSSLPVIIGDEFNPIVSSRAFESKQFNSGHELLSGVVANESSFDKMSLPSNVNKSIILKTIEQDLTDIAGSVQAAELQKIFDHYFASLPEDPKVLRDAYGVMKSDYNFVCPTYLMAKDYSSSSNSSTYFYVLTYKTSIPYNSVCFDEFGVCHAEDLNPQFGVPFIAPEKGFDQTDREFSLLYMFLWTNFAKNGDPLVGDPPSDLKFLETKIKGVVWPKIGSNQVMVLNPYDFGTLLNDPYSACETIWRKYYK